MNETNKENIIFRLVEYDTYTIYNYEYINTNDLKFDKFEIPDKIVKFLDKMFKGKYTKNDYIERFKLEFNHNDDNNIISDYKENSGYVVNNLKENTLILFNIRNLNRLTLYKCVTCCLLDLNDLDKYINDIYEYSLKSIWMMIDYHYLMYGKIWILINPIMNKTFINVKYMHINDIYNYLIMYNTYRRYLYSKIQKYNYKFNDFINDEDVKYVINVLKCK